MRFLRLASLGLALLLSSVSPILADPISFPIVTASDPTSLPLHIPQYAQLRGCYHTTNGTCPAPVSSVTTDYNYLSNYVDYDETDARAFGAAFQAGMKAGVYVDPVFIHGGTIYNGVNLCTGGTSNTLPDSILQHERSYGSTIMVPNSAQGICNGQQTSSELGDITSPAAWAFWNTVVSQNAAFSHPTAAYFKSGLSFVRIDDVYAGFDNAVNGLLCAGPGYLSAAGTFTSCTQAGPPALVGVVGGTYTITGDNLPFPRQRFPNYAGDDWTQGVKNFFRSFSNLQTPIFWNDDTDPLRSYKIMGDADHANTIAGQCENCIVRNGTNLWSDTVWRNHIDMLIYNASNGMGTHFFNPVMNSQADQVYLYASIWMGIQNPWSVIVTDEIGGSLSYPPSGIAITPLSYIIPTEPIADPPGMYFDPIAINYNPANPPAHFAAGDLARATGVYVREFAQCYRGDSGTQTAVGKCAAIVATPAAATSTNLSALKLHGAYAHQQSFTGTGIATAGGFGDTFTLSVSGTAAPTTIAQGTAVLLFQ